MEPDRRHHLLQQLSTTTGETMTHKICHLALLSDMDAAAILLQSSPVLPGIAATAGALGDHLARIEAELGEGPGHEAMDSRVPVFAEQLLSGSCEKWPMFAQEAQRSGLASAFAFPLHLGSICVGALTLGRAVPGKLDPVELIDLSNLALFATSALLLMQSGLQEGEMFDLLEARDPSQLRIHQATGMVAQQMSVSLSDALALMRGYALTNDVTMSDLAENIISRKIRMDNS